MKRNLMSSLALGAVMALFLSGCATSGVPDLEDSSIYRQQPTLFEVGLLEMKQATIQATTTLNCRTLAETETYYKGQMPYGEVVEVFLKQNDPAKTSVWIKSKWTYVGGAWQHDRTAEVMQELKRAVALLRRKNSTMP